MRCFVGIRLSDEVRDTLVAACESLRDHDPSWRGEKWVAPHNLHVTLRFCGSVDERDADRLVDDVRSALCGYGPLSLEPTGIRAVPNLRRSTMLWATFAEDRDLSDLARAVAESTSWCDAETGGRPFKPHVTLVRARRPRRLDAGAVAEADAVVSAGPQVMSVPSATVFESTLTRTGPTYRTIAELPLLG